MAVTRLSPPVLFLALTSMTCGGAQVKRAPQLSLCSHYPFIKVYPFKCWEHTCDGAEGHTQQLQGGYSFIFKFIYNQRCSLFAKSRGNNDIAFLEEPQCSHLLKDKKLQILFDQRRHITFPDLPSQAYRLPSSPKLQSENLSLYFSCRHWPSTGLMEEK